MASPSLANPRVDRRGLGCRLDTQRVALIVTAARARRAHVVPGAVARQLVLARATHLAPEVAGVAGPVGEGVERAAIAERDGGRLLDLLHRLELALHREDGQLCRLARRRSVAPREPFVPPIPRLTNASLGREVLLQ